MLLFGVSLRHLAGLLSIPGRLLALGIPPLDLGLHLALVGLAGPGLPRLSPRPLVVSNIHSALAGSLDTGVDLRISIVW